MSTAIGFAVGVAIGYFHVNLVAAGKAFAVKKGWLKA